ncbi:MAG: hypothetical protein JO057_28175 [Chloroflexi bacterium]|nr:hypothetical protein [Chloroflexota bacterium]
MTETPASNSRNGTSSNSAAPSVPTPDELTLAAIYADRGETYREMWRGEALAEFDRLTAIYEARGRAND